MPTENLIDELRAENAKLRAALEDVRHRIENSDHWWIDDPAKGGFDMDMIEAALGHAD